MTVRRSLALALIVGLTCGLVPMVFRSLTDSFLFYPQRGQWRTPADLGLPFEELRLDADGIAVQAWWVAGTAAGPVIVMFHGNGGTIADRLDNVAELVSRFDASVLQVEYPGYGDSGGRPSEASLHAAGEAGLAEARRRSGGREIVVFGRSLGGAVAIDLASRFPVDGLIVESTFTSLRDMAAASGLPFARHVVAYRFDSAAKIAAVEAPVLLVHGDRDEIVPYRMSVALLDAAVNASSRLHTVRGGRHNDTWLIGGETYWSAWSAYLRSIGGSPAP